MITINTVTEAGVKGKCDIPTTWRDFTWGQLVELTRPYPNRIEKLAAFTGIDSKVLMNNIPFLHQVNEISGFIFNGMDEYAEFIPKDVRKKLKPIGEDDWMKYEHTQVALNKHPERDYEGTIEMLRYYLGIEVADRPCTEVYGLVMHYFKQLQEFAAKFKELANVKPDPDEVAAGVSRFDKYGVYNTLAMFTGGDPTKNEQYEKAPLEAVYLELMRRKDAKEFAEDLTKVKKANAEVK